MPENSREVTPVVTSTYQLRSRSRRTRAEGEGEPNERTPLLKKVSLNIFSFSFHDNMVCTEYGNSIYKHILLVLSPLIVTCQVFVTIGHSSLSCLP